jgi:hypothetical protein
LRARILEKLASREEPLWREVAHWLVIISFFSLPLVVLVLHLSIAIEHINYKAHEGEFAYLWSFHKVLAALLATIMGLNSWDKRNGPKNGAF